MKAPTLILTLFLTLNLSAQMYYGANTGVVIGKSYDGKTKEIRHGINDLFLSVPIGYIYKERVLFEVEPQGTLSLIPSISGMIGVKFDFSDNAGIHLLAGYKDEMAIYMEHFSVTHYFFPKGTVRLWLGQASLRASFIPRKYGGNQFEIGIGLIGLVSQN